MSRAWAARLGARRASRRRKGGESWQAKAGEHTRRRKTKEAERQQHEASHYLRATRSKMPPPKPTNDGADFTVYQLSEGWDKPHHYQLVRHAKKSLLRGVPLCRAETAPKTTKNEPRT